MPRLVCLCLLFLLLHASIAEAQHYSRGAARLGIIGGANVGGEEATLKYAQYTLHPFGMATGQYFPVNRFALSGSLFAGTLAAELSGRAQFPGYGRQVITDYDTKYYGASLGVDWMLPTFWELTPIAKVRLGTMMHHTRVNGENGFERRLAKSALLYSLGGGFEYSIHRDVKLFFSYDLTLTNSDELDGLASGDKNDALSVLSVGLTFLLKPGDPETLPKPRPDELAARRAARSKRIDTLAPPPVASAETDEWGPATSPAWYEGTYDPARDAVALGSSASTDEQLLPVEKGGKLQLATSLKITPIRRFADLEEDPALFTLTAKQTGSEAMQLKNYVEVLRDNKVIFQGNTELQLSGRERSYSAREFLNLDELLLRTEGDAPLARGNYVVRVSTVAWDQELSSISQAKFLNIDLRPIFGAASEQARDVIVSRAVDAAAEDEDALVVNFFDPPQRAGISAPADSKTAREALRLSPYSMGTDSREKYLAEGVDRSAAEALRLRGLASNNRDASRLKVVIAEVFFPLDEDRLAEESRILLDNVARHLNQHPELSVEVRGYANDIGDESWNANLAVKRAQRVVEYLVRQKTSSWRLEARESDEYLAPIRPGEDPRSGRKAEIVLITH